MRRVVVLLPLIVIALATTEARAHCEVPCGIYGDELRVALLYEHIDTIEKAMKQIDELSKQSPVNYNQIVRWVTTKEDHAKKIQELAWQYFLAQRIKPVPQSDKAAWDKYVLETTTMQQIIVSAMKSKQSTDTGHTTALRKLVEKFEASYFQADKKKILKPGFKMPKASK